MKRITACTFIVITLVFSCSEEILDVENKEALTTDSWYRTVEDFEAAINSSYIAFMEYGLYGYMYTTTVGTYEDRVLYETTVRDNLTTLTPSGDEPSCVWGSCYHGVYRTSRILQKLGEKGLEGIEGMTRANMDYIAAQAKAIRGMCYFYLCILFDRPILYDETSIPDDYLADYGNAERNDLWNQIEKDLGEAIPDLKPRSELTPGELGRITSGAATSALGKVMLYKHYYFHERFGQGGAPEDIATLQKARDLFLDVMNSNEYRLIQPMEPKTEKDYLYAILCNSSFLDLPSEHNLYDSENNPESIWEVQFGDDKAIPNTGWFYYSGYEGGGALNEKCYSPHLNSYKNHEAHPLFWDAFETEGAPAPFDADPRRKASFYFHGDTMDFSPDSPYHIPFNSESNIKQVARTRNIPVPGGTGGLGIKKTHFPVYWDGLTAPLHDPINKRIIRYADVLLMYSEVMYLLGDDGSGLDALNQVRRRVDMPDVTSLTTDAIIHERDIELAFEGHRWLDLVRWSFSPEWGIDWNEIQWGINGDNSVNPFVVGKHEFFPIPLEEIEVNGGKLVQNPGY
jgi:hypothetical protein